MNNLIVHELAEYFFDQLRDEENEVDAARIRAMLACYFEFILLKELESKKY
jgi:hypothetical protein